MFVGNDTGATMNTEHIIKLAETYGKHRSLELSTVSTYAENDGKWLPRLKAGSGCTLRRAARVLNWFSANWPADLEWPREIPRPTSEAEASRKRRAA